MHSKRGLEGGDINWSEGCFGVRPRRAGTWNARTWIRRRRYWVQVVRYQAAGPRRDLRSPAALPASRVLSVPQSSSLKNSC